MVEVEVVVVVVGLVLVKAFKNKVVCGFQWGNLKKMIQYISPGSTEKNETAVSHKATQFLF